MFFSESKDSSKSLALLLDPDKTILNEEWLSIIIRSSPDYILLGGSQPFPFEKLDSMIQSLRLKTNIPIVGFPGDSSQLHPNMHGLLALSVVQSKNSEYVLESLKRVLPTIEKHNIDTYFTPYIILAKDGNTSVEKALQNDFEKIQNEELYRKYLQLISILNTKTVYLEAGSGATSPIELSWIEIARSILKNQYLLVGGGIRKISQAETLWAAGANCIVVGNAIEDDPSLLIDFCEARNQLQFRE